MTVPFFRSSSSALAVNFFLASPPRIIVSPHHNLYTIDRVMQTRVTSAARQVIYDSFLLAQCMEVWQERLSRNGDEVGIETKIFVRCRFA